MTSTSSTPSHLHPTAQDLLDEAAMDTATLARACRQSADWVHARVVAGILAPDQGVSAQSAASSTVTQWRFSCTTIVRARRVAQLEHMYEADPQLAALTVDLMEEVLELRRKVHGG